MNTEHGLFARVVLLAAVFVLMISSGFAATDRVRVVRAPQDGAVPDAEIGEDGVVHIAYVANDDVFYARSTDDAATFSTPLRVNTRPGTAHPPGMYRGPDLALGQDGAVHVIWYVNAYQKKAPKEESGVYYSRMTRTEKTFEPERNLNHLPSDNYSVAADARGQVAVIWMARGLNVTLSRDGGKSFAAAENVAIADSCECCASRAFIDADGTLFCAYRDKAGNQRDMFLLTRRTGGSAWTRSRASGSPWQINGCPMTGTYLSNGKSGPVMAWETKSTISFARFDSTGQKQGEEIVVTEAGGKFPIVLAAPDGVTCLSWKKGAVLHWRLFGSNGKPMGEEASQPSSNGNRHAGVVIRNGDFVLID